MMNKKILVIMFTIFMLALSACSPATTDETNTPTPSVNEGYEKVTEPNPAITSKMVSVLDTDIASLNIDDITYSFRDAENSLGDKSSFKKVPGVFMYLAWMDLDYSYTQPDSLADTQLYLKILGKSVGDDLDTVYYSGDLVDGKTSITFETGIETPASNPRMNFCVSANPNFDPLSKKGDVACNRLIGTTPKHSLSSIRDEISLNFDLPVVPLVDQTYSTSGSIPIKNDGTVPITVYFVAKQPDGKDVEFTYEPASVQLAPGQEQDFAVTAAWTYDSGFVKNTKLLAFALPVDCVNLYSCAEKAKIKLPIDLKFRNE